MRALAFLSLLVGSCVALPVLAANSSPEAGKWLSKLAQAERHQNYQASFIYERNGSFSTHQIWHLVRNGTSTERLFRLDGDVQEVVRVDGRVSCASGDLTSAVGAPGKSSANILDPLKLMSWYDLSVIGESRVAGRNAITLSLAPRDPHRYGFDLDLDRQTGLPLRSLMVNEKGQMLERYQVISLDTRQAPDAVDLQGSPACKPLEPTPARKPGTVVEWRAEWLPAGFELVGSAQARGEGLSSLMYDDGLARFSIFLEPIAAADGKDIRTQLGPTAAVSRHLATAKGDMLVTVVGEIPLGTAERIALSMKWRGAQASR